MANGLSSILGGLAQGFTDLGKSAADMLGGTATNNALTVGLDALINKKSYAQATKDADKRLKDYRKWLYDTDSDMDAAAKGLGTALNGAQTAIDLIPGIGQAAPVNALQGAVSGLADEFKFNGENYDWGKGLQRAGVGAASNLAAGGLGKALADSGSKVLSNGVLKGAATGSLGGALSQAGNTAIEGGNADQILQSAAQGAKFGALMGAGTGGVQTLAGALKNARAKNGAPVMDEEVVMAELEPEQMGVANLTNGPKTYYHGSPETDITEFDINRAGKNTRSGEKAIYFTDTPEAAEEFAYERIPTDSNFVDKAGKRGGVYEVNLDMRNTLDLDNLTDEQIKELWPYASYMGSWQGEDVFARDLKKWRDVKNPQLIKGYLDLEKLANSPYDSFSATMYPNTGNTAKEYGIFDASKAKIIKTPNAATEVMASRVPEGQLGLFDQTATKTPDTNYGQLGLFDQPMQPVKPQTIDVADVNPYAPVNGEVTQTMRDRAAETMKNYRKGIPENELWNRIDPETLPEGYMQLRDVLDQDAAQAALKQRFGTTDMKKVGFEKLLDYVYEDTPEMKDRKRAVHNQEYAYTRDRADRLGISVPKNYATDAEKTLRKMAEVKASSDIVKNLKKQLEGEAGIIPKDTLLNISDVSYKDDAFRKGYTAAADNALSERLGIAPGNTLKRNGRYDSTRSLGRYAHRVNNGWGQQHKGGNVAISPSKTADPEDAISTMAHERLHSFQNEATNPDNATGRYNKEVLDAYNDLNKDLKEFIHDNGTVASRYGRSAYWAKPIEQEARMLQNYLENKGYTDSGHMKNKYRAGEWGNEINPAFDKFFDKLRELSKKGVALPAILAALGLGEYATENQEEDKDNGQQI